MKNPINGQFVKQYNNFEIIYDPSGAYVLIELTQGQYGMCDINDWFDNLDQYKWNSQWSEGTKSYYVSGNRIKFHRMVFGITDRKIEVDHIDHNTLDNRKKNLRLCEGWQNKSNRKQGTTISGFKGVHIQQQTIDGRFYQRWNVIITSQKKSHRKSFPFTEEGLKEAVNWRDNKAIELHGAFAITNKMLGLVK